MFLWALTGQNEIGLLERAKRPTNDMAKPTIILAFGDYSNDQAAHLRELGNEQYAVTEALRTTQIEGLCQVEVIAKATVERIQTAFQRSGGSVVGFHFAGHANGYQLMLDEAGDAHVEGFARYLGNQAQLQFVFLNACSTRGHVDALHEAGIPVVIATDWDVKDEVARQLAASFYSFLGQGWSLQAAFSEYEHTHKIKNTPAEALRGLGLRNRQGFPWHVHVRPGAREVLSWDLATAAGDFLFGLDLPDHYPLPNKPFRSLKRFEKEHARIFFGRGREIRDLYNKIIDRGLNRIILFYGQSGVGKSSLLEAGLLPRLEHQFTVKYLRRDGKTPLHHSLLSLLQSLSNAPEETTDTLWSSLEKATGKPLVVILDQVEEIFTRPVEDAELDELGQLVKRADQLLNNNVEGKLILAYRKEYHGDIEKAFESQNLLFTKSFIQRLTKEGIVEAVTGVSSVPLLQKQYDLVVDLELPEIIADDLQEDEVGAVAPVLQILLDKMWSETNSEQPHFTLELYRQLKKEGILLQHFVRDQLAAIREWNQEAVDSGLALDVLYFFTTVYGTAAVHSLTTMHERYGDRSELIDGLLQQFDKRLLLVRIPSSEPKTPPSLRLSHDTLAPVIRSEFENSNHPGQTAHRLMANLKIADWEDNPQDYLLNREQVRLLQRGQAGMRKWKKSEADLVAASQKAIERQARLRTVMRGVLTGAGLLVVTLLFFLYQNERAKNRLVVAESLEEQADLSNDPTQQFALLARSLELDPTESRRQRLAEVYRNNIFYRVIHNEENLRKAAISPDGRYFAIETSEGANFVVKQYELREGALVFQHGMQSQLGNQLVELTYSQNGDYLLGGGSDRRIHCWKLNGDSLPNQRLPHVIENLAVSPDGKLVALTFQNENYIEQWDVTNNEKLDSVTYGGSVRDLAFSYDGAKLMVADLNGGSFLQSSSLETEWSPILSEGMQHIVFSPDREHLAVVNNQGEVVFLKIASMEPAARFSRNAQASTITFSQQGDLFLIGYRDGAGELYRWSDRRRLYELRGHSGAIIAARFSKDSKQVFTVDNAGVFRAWDLPLPLPSKT